MTTPREVLERAYNAASANVISPSGLTAQQQEWVQEVVARAETQKAVLAVLLTSLVKKSISPQQDIRLHQIENMPGGYSGRTFDTQFVTPFLHEKMPRLAMSESGWLTRSLEQNHPYTLNYPGKIRDKAIRSAFLQILNDVQTDQTDPAYYLREFFILLLRHADAAQIVFASTPEAGKLTIESAVQALKEHFFAKYKGAGASRLPVLAVHSIYAVSMKDEEYTDKRLLPLKSHTTSDLKSSSLGDVEIVDADGNFFEAIEIKHNIAITPTLVENAFAKFQQMPISRYYLLTTATPNSTHADVIRDIIKKVRGAHGCEIIVNGVLPTIQYYLRRGQRTAAFLQAYTQVIEADFAANTDLKEVHLKRWNEILTELHSENE